LEIKKPFKVIISVVVIIVVVVLIIGAAVIIKGFAEYRMIFIGVEVESLYC